ncbi:MAG TPA: hypothetical protein VKU01_11670 [Bryobacteraceae bacterium]|nr:hypothetical protein [Bryobacteraceae bacterium]
MKKLITCFALFCVGLFADVSGKWTGTAEVTADGSQSKTSTTLDLKQDGNALTGSAGQNGEYRIRKGTLDGNTLKIELDVDGQSYYLVLTVDGDKIKGSASADPEGTQIVAKVELERQK